MLGTMMDFPLTLVPILERAGKLYSQIEIVSRRPDRSWCARLTATMYRRARRLARALELAGLARGDRVATLMWNHSAHLEAYFGIPASGGVVAHAEPSAASRRARLHRESRARSLFDR